MGAGDQSRHVMNKTCDICGRGFARNEHLIRHRRIHTRERPFHCPHCKIGFPRSDVREKHMKKFHSVDESPSQPPLQKDERLKPKEAERSKLACDQCRKRKLKCNNSRPCESCRTKLLPCTVSGSSRPPGRPRNIVPIASTDESTVGHDTSDQTISPIPDSWTADGFQQQILPSITVGDIPDVGSSLISYHNAVDLTSHELGQSLALEVANNFPLDTSLQGESLQLHQGWDEMDMMDDLIPHTFPENWLAGLDDFSTMDDIWPLNFLPSDLDCNSPMENAVDMMKDHLQRRSRAPSPAREEQKRSWYSAPPNLYIYDEDVVNVLLNIARINIASSFAIFADFEANFDTRVELCLAMAAVGGLYCKAQGGTKVAKKLFNDSRRLLLEEYLQETSLSFEESLSFSKTFILLEIYGLCSGDKRAYEFIEVFHASKLHVISTCLNSLPHNAPLELCRQGKLLSEAMQVLDTYRVLLLQQPPSVAPQQQANIFQCSIMRNIQDAHIRGLGYLLSPDCPLESPIADMHHLATIICYSWMANSSSGSLWKAEFIELALNRWIQASPPPNLTQLLLFHLAHVSLHSSLKNLQLLTQGNTRSSLHSQRRNIPESVRAWRESSHFAVCQWHAKTILRVVQEAMAPPRRAQPFEKNMVQFIEAPHLPLCIYFATLIMWWGDVASDGNGRSGDAEIEAGSQLLFSLKVHVSKQLGNALCELRSMDV